MTKAIFVFLAWAFLSSARASALECSPDAMGVKRVIEVGPTEPVGLKTYPRTLALMNKELALTFDDGPLPATTPIILDILRDECVKAVFFLIGRNAAAHPELVRRIVAEGHTIAHHSYSHPAITLRNMKLSEALADIAAGVSADEKAAFGATAKVGVKFFRYPGFADSAAMNEKLMAQNVAIFGADLWSSDWRPMSAEAQYELIWRRIEAAGKGIVLMHDTKQQTAQSLRRLLRTLKDHGYSIVQIKPGENPPAIETAPNGWTSETERTLKSQWPKIVQPAGVSNDNEPAKGTTSHEGEN